MKGQQQTAGESYEQIEIGGKEYTLRQLTVGQYAEMEAYIVSLRSDPIKNAAERIGCIPNTHQDAYWEAAIRASTKTKNVSLSDFAEFERSPSGVAWKLWKSVEQDHPEVDSLKKAMDLVVEAGPERLAELKAKLTVSTGETAVKN